MTDVPATLPAVVVKRKVIRRRLVYSLCAVALFSAVAYWAMPIWLPTSWLAARLGRQLSTQLGSDVRIGSLSIGWGSGVEIHDITIIPHDSNQLLARIERVHSGFSPWQIVSTGQVDVLEIDRPQIWLTLDEDGHVDLPQIQQSSQGGLPTQKYVVRDAVCHVSTPEVTQTFTIEELVCRLDEANGKLTLHAGTGVRRRLESTSNGTLNIDVDLVVPQLNPDLELKLSGDGHLTWSNLALSDLPVPIAAQLPIEQVAGQTDGEAHFRAHEDLSVDFDLKVAMAGVEIRDRSDDETARIPDAQVAAEGHWDPNFDMLIVNSASYRSQALRIHKPLIYRGEMLVIDPKGETQIDLHATGTVEDFDQLREELPTVAALLKDKGIHLGGRLTFELAVEEGLRHDRYNIDIVSPAGAEWQWTDADDRRQAVLPAEARKSLHARYVYDHLQERVTDAQATLTCGDITIEAAAEVAIATPLADSDPLEWLRAWRSNRIVCSVDVNDLASLRQMFPIVNERLDIHTCRGPAEMKFSLAPGLPDDDQTVLTARCALSSGSVLRIDPWIDKRLDKALVAELNGIIPYDEPHQQSRIGLHLGYGDALVDTFPPLVVTFETIDSDDGIEGIAAFATEGECRIRDIKGILSLSPILQETIKHSGIHRLAGDARIATRLAYDGRDSSHRKLDGSWRIDGDHILLDASPYVHKPKDLPIQLGLSCQLDYIDDILRFTHAGSLTQSTGEVTWQATAASPKGGLVPTHLEAMSLTAEIRQVDQWLTTLPWLKSAASTFAPTGRLRARLDHEIGDGQTEGRAYLSIDATDASFNLPAGIGLDHKPRGMRSDCEFRLVSQSTGGSDHWKMTEGSIAIGGLQIDRMTGQISTHSANNDERTTVNALDRIEAMNLSIDRASVNIDALLPYIDEAHAADLDRWAPGGRVDWRGSLAVADDRVTVSGTIDADRLSMSHSFDNPFITRIQKRPDLPMSLGFNVEMTPDGDSDARVLQLEADGSLADNKISAAGTIHLDGHSCHRSPRLDLTAQLNLVDPDALLSMIPGSAIEALRGRLTAEVAIAGPFDTARINTAHVGFDDWRMQIRGEPFTLNGAMTITPDSVDVPDLTWAWGEMDGRLSSHIEREADRYAGLVGVHLSDLDVPEMQRRIESLTAQNEPAGTTSPPSTGDAPIQQPFSPQAIIPFLARCGVQVDVSMDSCRLFLPPSIDALTKALVVQLQTEQGPTSLTFSGAVDGGAVTGSLETRLDTEDPDYRLKYSAENLQPGPVVDAYLAMSFPGLIATGPLTLHDESLQKVFPAEGEWETGSGELIIEGGSVEGRAAPQFIANIFPNLNLAKYEFSYMHSWFNKLANGRIYHNMIYHGNYYNVYMKGFSERDSSFDYEVGIDFMADYDSQYWAELGQGRVPLFRKTGRLSPDGDILDESVTYQPPHRILDVLFVKNNPFVTAYYAVTRRATANK